MPYCAVINCPSYNGGCNGNNVVPRFHKFPSTDEFRRKWEDWVATVNKMGSFVAQGRAVLCSAHFEQECYMPSMRLRKTAVPSIVPMITADVACLFDMSNECDSTGNIHTGKVLSDKSNHSQPQVMCCPPTVPDLVQAPASRVPPLLLSRNVMATGAPNYDKGTTVVSEHDESDIDTSSCLMRAPRKRDRLAFVGDITAADISSPQRARRSLAIMQVKYKSMQTKIKSLKQALRRLKERNVLLESLNLEIRNRNKVVADSD